MTSSYGTQYRYYLQYLARTDQHNSKILIFFLHELDKTVIGEYCVRTTYALVNFIRQFMSNAVHNEELTRLVESESADRTPSQSSLYSSSAVRDSSVISGHSRSVVSWFSTRTLNTSLLLYTRLIHSTQPSYNISRHCHLQ